MKKQNIIKIGAGIILLLAAAAFLLFKSINKERVQITYEQFQSYVQENGMEFQDNRHITTSADLGDGGAANIAENVQVEFLECPSEDTAKGYFDTYYNYVQQFKDGKTTEKLTNLDHYADYVISTDVMYIRIVRINNTAMDARVPVEHKDLVIDFMKDLGYID